jgi:hypothetical protein
MRKFLLSLVLFYVVLNDVFAQSYELEQFSQLYRPRLRIDANYQHPIELSNKQLGSSIIYSTQQYQAHLSIPIGGKLALGAELDLTQPNIKAILKNSLKIKAWQLMLNARLGYKLSYFEDQNQLSKKNSNAYLGSIGLSGIKLTKRFKIMFYSANVNLAEELNAIRYYQFRGNATLGWAKIKGLRKYFIYGFHLSISDKLVAPIPFIGGRARINESWNFNYILPLQANIQFKPDKKWSYFLGVRPEGQRWGWYNGVIKGSYSFFTIVPHAAVRYTLNNNLQLRLEAGYNAYGRLRTVNEGFDAYNFKGNNSFYVQFTFNQMLGQSFLEQAIDRIL